jgi:hypothetical protein
MDLVETQWNPSQRTPLKWGHLTNHSFLRVTRKENLADVDTISCPKLIIISPTLGEPIVAIYTDRHTGDMYRFGVVVLRDTYGAEYRSLLVPTGSQQVKPVSV